MNKDWLLKIGGFTGITLVLAGVFSLYLKPEFVVGLANQVWLCF